MAAPPVRGPVPPSLNADVLPPAGAVLSGAPVSGLVVSGAGELAVPPLPPQPASREKQRAPAMARDRMRDFFIIHYLL